MVAALMIGWACTVQPHRMVSPKAPSVSTRLVAGYLQRAQQLHGNLMMVTLCRDSAHVDFHDVNISRLRQMFPADSIRGYIPCLVRVSPIVKSATQVTVELREMRALSDSAVVTAIIRSGIYKWWEGASLRRTVDDRWLLTAINATRFGRDETPPRRRREEEWVDQSTKRKRRIVHITSKSNAQ
ncbi:MAG: hypothetical protein IT353_23745 [Gemmatimonadaceae bacterium]|nr:hypothetical protein [Gemmatimonadaceae bacterium]